MVTDTKNKRMAEVRICTINIKCTYDYKNPLRWPGRHIIWMCEC